MAENNFIGKLIFINRPVVGKMSFKGLANRSDTCHNTGGNAVFAKHRKNLPYRTFPMLVARSRVDAAISEDGQLLVFYSNVKKYAVAVLGFLHF